MIQQSVRHHLSLNRLFERQQRPATDPGFGSYWTVNLEAPPGTKRPRKRGRTQKDLQPIPTPLMEKPAYIPVMPIRLDQPMHHHQPIPSPQRVVAPPLPAPPPQPPRREEGGVHQPMHSTILRPVDAHSFKTSAVRRSPYEEDDDDEMDWGPNGPHLISDEDFSDEDLVARTASYLHYQPPLSAASSSSTNASFRTATHSPVNHTNHTAHSAGHTPTHQSARQGLHGVFSSGYQAPAPPKDPVVQRLEQEIENMRRHSQDQDSLVIRLNNSLTRAETDAARAKQALKMAESRLEDETRRRVEAERAADEEARLRRHADEQFRAYQMRAAGLPSPR